MINGGKSEKIFSECLSQAIDGSQEILDVGTSQRFAKELRKYETFFQNKNYIAAGYRPSKSYGEYNCDCDENIEQLSFEDIVF